MGIFPVNTVKFAADKRVHLWIIVTVMILGFSHLAFSLILKNRFYQFDEKNILIVVLSLGLVINLVTSMFLLARIKHYMRISMWVLLIAPNLLLASANIFELYFVLVVNDLLSVYPILGLSIFTVSLSLMAGIILTAPIFASISASQEQLRASESKYRSIFETSSDAGVLVDNNTFLILDCNQKAVDYFGYSRHEMIGMKAIELSAEKTNTEHSFKNNIGTVQLRYFKRKNGTIFPAEISGTFFKFDDKEVRFGFIRDLTEKLKNEEQYQHSEERFRIAMDALNGYLYEIDLETNKAYRSQNFEQILGYTIDEIPNDLTADNKYIHPDDREIVVNDRNLDLLSGQLNFDREYRVRKKDGTYIIINDRGNIIRNSYGTAVKLYGSMIDITERKEAEKRVQESETYLQGILESTDDGILAVDNNGKIIKSNNRFAELWNIPVELLRSGDEKALLEHVQNQLLDPEEFLASIQILYNSDRSDFDVIHCKDERVFERYSTTLKLNDNIVGRVWSFRDITEQTKTERKIFESERLLKQSQEMSEIGSYVQDLKSGTWFGSDALGHIFGIQDDDDHSLKGWFSIIHSEERDAMKDYFLKDVIGKKNRLNNEFRIRKKNNGEVRWVHAIGELEYDASGIPVKIIGTIQDITEEKIADQILINSENKFRIVWENSLDAMRLADENGRMIMVNKAFCDLVEKSKEEVEGFFMESVYSTKDQEMLSNYRKYFINRKPNSLFESDMELWNGKTIPVEISHTFLTIPEQPPVLLSVFHDITYRKHAQQELNRERTLLRTVIDNIPDPIYVKDLQGRKILANIADAHYAGKQTVEEILGKTDAELYPEDIANHSRYEEETIFRTGVSMKNYEGTFQSSNGERRWLIGNKLLLKDSNGMNTGFLGINHDITKRKLAEEKNLMLAHTIESISEAVTVTDLENRLIYVNNAFSKMFDYSKEEVMGKHVGLLWSKNNTETLSNELLEHSKTGGWKGDLLFVSKNGVEFPIHLSTSQVKNEQGEIVALVGVAEDITERKKVIEAIHANEVFVKDILNSLAENIAVIDECGTIVEVNKAWNEFGLCNNNTDKSYNVGSNYFEVCNKAILSSNDDSARLALYGIKAVINMEQPFFSMEYSCSSSQEDRWFMMRVSPMSGPRKGVVVSHENITEQKRSQQLLLARLRISEFAKENTLQALLQKTLDEAELLTSSSIGSFHFVEADQLNRTLQISSTNTIAILSNGEGQGNHYPISNAEVWMDCIAKRKPVIHNNYETLPHRKGMPKGHAIVTRELVVPIIRNNKVTGLLGVGNKKTLYDEKDTKIIEQLSNLAWDVILRKQAEDAFTESEQRWRYALEGAGDAVWEWDYVNNTVFRSAQWKEMLGYSETEVNDSFSELERLVHPEDLASLNEAHQNNLIGEKDSFSLEYRLRCKNGEYKWILDRGKTMQFQNNGKPARIIGTYTDISAIKKIQSEMQELNEHLEEKVQERTRQLQEMNKQLETFSYSVSHDLRAPLRAIDSFSRILFEEEMEHISDNGKRQISLIRGNTMRMSRLIDDLLEFSRTNRSELKKMQFDMNVFVKKILNEYTTAEPERMIETRVHPLPKSLVDPSLFRQVFINLIGNAIKFSKHRDVSVIEIGGFESELETTYFIKDNGAGFDMRYVDKLFGVFQRLHTESEFEGTGVGLAIVQRIIQRHGGTIWAEGEPEKGATFTFTIPKHQNNEHVL